MQVINAKREILHQQVLSVIITWPLAQSLQQLPESGTLSTLQTQLQPVSQAHCTMAM